MASYTDPGLFTLARRAQRLRAHSAWGPLAHLPALFFLTDPARIPDPVAVAATLPRGAGVILRHFGRPQARAEAEALQRIAAARGLIFLIAADPELAEVVGAHGVHWPAARLEDAQHWRRTRPGALMTLSAHGARELRIAAACGADAAFLSPVFASRSPSAGRALGVSRFTELVGRAGVPVLALGGVTVQSVRRLEHTGAAGVGVVDAAAARTTQGRRGL